MWKDLSIQEKAALINIGVKNGLYDLEDIKNSYNKYAEGGDLQGATPRRATPSKQRKSWETDEDYERRMLTYDESKVDSIKLENERLKEQDRINRETYLKTKEGQQKQLKIQKEDSTISSMLHVPQQETSSLHHANNVVMDAMRSKIDNAQLAEDTKEAIEQQYQDKLDKWHDYKKSIESTITGLELGLSGA